MASSQLVTLGRFAFCVDDQALSGPSTRKARALMAYLVLHRGRDVSRDRLVELFWADADVERARENLNTALWAIRRALRDADADVDSFLFANKALVRWCAATDLDAAVLEAAAASPEPARWREAVAVYGGDFLEGDFNEWAVAEREHLSAVYEDLLAKLVVADADPDLARLLVERNPYDENAYVVLIEAELAAGRHVNALALAARARAALLDVGAVPSPAFEALSARLHAPPPSSPRALEVPFVGRELELAQIEALADAQRGVVVIVHGEAGIGKSAFVRRTIERARERGRHTVYARCLEHDPRPTGPWIDLLEDVSGRPWPEALDAPRLARVNPIAVAVADRLEPAGLLVIEDLHYLRGDALNVLTALVPLAVRRDVITVITTRPEGLPAARDVAVEPVAEIVLAPLSLPSLEEALARATGSPMPELATTLHQRSGGHPLFFSALLEELHRNGALRAEARGWSVSPGIELDQVLPSSIARYVEHRLRSRGTDAVLVAGALALEASARTSEVATVTGLPEERVLDAVDDLLAIGFLIEALSGPQFAFVHDLVRDAAAKSIGAAWRGRIHRAYAELYAAGTYPRAHERRARHLEALGEAHAAAQSYLRAEYEASGSQRTRDAVEQVTAGLRVMRALHEPEHEITRAQLCTSASRAFVWIGEIAQAVWYAEEAVRIALAVDDPSLVGPALVYRSLAYFHAGEMEAAVADAERGAAAAAQAGNAIDSMMGLLVAARALRALGRIDDAIAFADRLEADAQRLGSHYHVTAAVSVRFVALTNAWRFREARALYPRYSAAAHATVHHVLIDLHFQNAALAYLMGKTSQAQDALARARDVIRELPTNPRYEGGLRDFSIQDFHCTFLSAVMACARRDWDAAVADATHLLTAPIAQQQSSFRERAGLVAVDALLGRDAAGDTDRAAAIAAGLAPMRQAWDIFVMSYTPAVARARVAARRGSPDASKLLESALADAERLAGLAPVDADRTFADLGTAAAKAGADAVAERANALAQTYGARRRAAIAAAAAVTPEG